MNTTQERLLQRNVWLYYLSEFFDNSAFTLPIYILFGREYLGVNYFQAGLLLMGGWFVSIIFDFWGGTIADKFGRKEAYVYGMAIKVLTCVPFLVTKSYSILLISALIHGIGIALSSNSIDALIYEQSVAVDAKDKYQHANATAGVFVFMGRIYATLLGGLTYAVHPRLPYFLYTIALMLALIAGLKMYIPKKIDEIETPSRLEMMRTAIHVYSRNKVLLIFMVFSFLYAFWGDMLFSYYQPYFINLKVSPATLGFLFSAISVCSAFGSFLMRKLPSKISAQAIVSLELLGVVTSAFLLLLFRLPLVLIAPLFLGVISGFMQPIMRLYVNRHAENKVRASVLSFASTVYAVGTGLGFLLSFYLADRLPSRTVVTTVLIGASLSLVFQIDLRTRKVNSESTGGSNS